MALKQGQRSLKVVTIAGDAQSLESRLRALGGTLVAYESIPP